MVLFSYLVIKVHSFVGHNLFQPLERLEHLDVKKTTATGVCDCPHTHCPKHRLPHLSPQITLQYVSSNIKRKWGRPALSDPVCHLTRCMDSWQALLPELMCCACLKVAPTDLQDFLLEQGLNQ